MSLFEAIFFTDKPHCEIIRIFAEIHFKIAPRLTLKKEERLKSRKLIEQLFKSGKVFSIVPLRIIYILSSTEKYILQSGFGVPTKKFKKAVDRNRVKRLMKEVYRLQKNRLKEVLQNNQRSMAVFFIYTGNTINQYEEIFKTMQTSLKKLEHIANENPAANS